MFGSGMNLITTVIGFGMSATFIVFICIRIICGRVRRVESGQMFEIESRIDLEQPEHRINGLEPVLVAAIPTMRFHREAFSCREDAQCSICLGEYQEKEVLRIMPKCGHNFHLSCIDIWLRKQNTCPVCRFPLQDTLQQKHITTVRQQASFNDSSETTIDNSTRWLLPNNESSSVQNGSNQRRLDIVGQEPNHGQTETREM